MPSANVDFAHYIELARTAERGKFDLLFLADSAAMRNWPLERSSRVATYVAGFEPITLLSALAPVTSNIGLVATATTTYNEPFHVARKFASLDHISGGRAGWNLVTSVNIAEAFNFGREAACRARRALRPRAPSSRAVVRGLWDSWEDDAFVRDKESGASSIRRSVHRARPQGRAFLRARAAQRAALAAGPAGDGAGRHVRGRAGTVGGSRRHRVRHQPDARERAELLHSRSRAASPNSAANRTTSR